MSTESQSDDRPGPAQWLSDPDTAHEVLDQVRRSTVELLAKLPSQPQALRVRAGAVSMEVVWNGHPDTTTVVTTEPATGHTTSVAAVPDHRRFLRSPIVGVFYVAPSPGAPPFVSPGDTVTPGQQVGIVEAMKLMVPVESDCAGEVLEVLKEDATPVEYGDQLFAVAAADE